MTSKRPNLFTRDDTFFGVCEGLGEDLHLPSNLVRLAFVPLLFLYPVAAFGLYAGLGVLVALTRWLVPDRTGQAQVASINTVPNDDGRETEAEALPLAA